MLVGLQPGLERPDMQEVGKAIGSLPWMTSMGRLCTQTAYRDGTTTTQPCGCGLFAPSKPLDSGIDGTVVMMLVLLAGGKDW